jgi:hypothetical protein
MARVSNFLRGLQLYKRGRLIAGDSLFLISGPLDYRLIARCTEMNVNFGIHEQYRPLYEFNANEVREFLSFLIQFYKISLKAFEYQEIELSISTYCNETAHHGDVVDLMTALESLLVPEEEGIAFKLSQRVANLLGTDPEARKELFKKVKNFYGLRSRIVHGAKVGRKEFNLQLQIDELREITRRAILAVMTLAADTGMGPDFPSLLNDLCLDDDLRRSVQTKTSALLHT